MSFTDLEFGTLRAPRKARGPDATHVLVFQITTAVASYRRLLLTFPFPSLLCYSVAHTIHPYMHHVLVIGTILPNSSYGQLVCALIGRRLVMTFFNWQRMRKISSGELLKQTRALKLVSVAEKRIADMKLAKDFAATI